MASILQFSYIFVAFIVLGVWASQTTAARTLYDTSMLEKHEQWMALHGRVYVDAAERERRFTIFKKNVQYIESINNAGRPYKLSVNGFADLTNEEFKASRNGYKSPFYSKATPFKYENVTVVPSSMDWRKKGAVTPIKDQGQCGKTSLFIIKISKLYKRFFSSCN